MRLIGTLANEIQARKLAAYLASKGMESHCDPIFDAKTGHISYHLWVLDEDRISEAAQAFAAFIADSSHPQFEVPLAMTPPPPPSASNEETQEEETQEEETMEAEPKEKAHIRKTPLTSFFLSLCMMVFMWNYFEIVPFQKMGIAEDWVTTPIQVACFYDVPPPVEIMQKILKKFEETPKEKRGNPSEMVHTAWAMADQIPYWRGLYEWMTRKIEGNDPSLALGPMFVKIRQGEVWRLFSPCILHINWLHLAFNMIWLWLLGRLIEQRLGILRTLLLTLAIGIGSNTLQYLVSGPFFIGYSGVVMGLAGYIWMRQKLAPWEGYPLDRRTIFFLLLFIGAMFFLSVASLASQFLFGIHFNPKIANTAHVVGGLIGLWLGRFSFFARKVS